MNRRNFIKGVAATAAGMGVALFAKDRVEAEKPLSVVNGEGEIGLLGTQAKILPIHPSANTVLSNPYGISIEVHGTKANPFTIYSGPPNTVWVNEPTPVYINGVRKDVVANTLEWAEPIYEGQPLSDDEAEAYVRWAEGLCDNPVYGRYVDAHK